MAKVKQLNSTVADLPIEYPLGIFIARLPEGLQVLARHSPIFDFLTTDQRYWHVTVGKNFGCHAVHEKQRFVGLPLAG